MVVGGGPAGCAAAATAARARARVALLDAATSAAGVGEGAAPGTPRLIEEVFGSAGAFDGGAHVPCPSIVSAWGAVRPTVTDHMLNPLGVGWNLDRGRFDADLRAACGGLGVEVVSGSRLSRDHLLSDDRAARIVVDASGRGARVARLMGARKQHLDRLVALWAIWSVDAGDSSAATYVEAVRDGWWYSALLPQSRRTVVFLTDADLLPGERRAHLDLAPSAVRLELIGALLDAARARDRRRTEPDLGAKRPARPVLGPGMAGGRRRGGRLRPTLGARDRCALLTGRSAGEAAVAMLLRGRGSRRLKRHHDLIASLIIDDTINERTATYRAETRWPDTPFWSRRVQRHSLRVLSAPGRI